MIDFLSQPWPWYVAGPLIGLIVPALLLIGGKQFGDNDIAIGQSLLLNPSGTVDSSGDFIDEYGRAYNSKDLISKNRFALSA